MSSFELGPIRPPSEAYSLLIRVTKNCPWNRCRFCHTYKGAKFELRSVEEIKQDIRTAKAIQDEVKELAWKSGSGGKLEQTAALVFNNISDDAYRNVALWLYADGRSAFLQDADSLIVKAGELAEVIRFLKETFPSIERITSYARAKTVIKKKLEELVALREAGLSRIHIGLESGYDPLLQYVDKGVTAAEHIAAGRKVVESGISLSEYVILGLGGKKWWREHAIHTARVLNEINPDFIRFRTLNVNDRMPLHNDVNDGSFIRETDEEIVREERLLLENLECTSNLVSDHITNLLQEIEGKLPEDKQRMLSTIDRFQALTPKQRTGFIIGRRIGMYTGLDDMNDRGRRVAVEQVIRRLGKDGGEVGGETVFNLMKGFI